MGGGRRVWVAWAVVLLAGGGTVVLGVRSWPWEKGDVDPVAVLMALATLVSAVLLAWWQVGRSERLTPVDTGKWADHLADAVRAAETRQRQQLLAGHPEPLDLEFVFAPAPAHDALGADPAGSLSGIVEYFDRLEPQRLVITGEPGSGKTVTAIQLILLLLDPSRRQPGGPVPVRVSAASWDPADGVHAWLARRLAADYKMDPRNARLLVDGGLVLPVIDGLDEMDHADTHASHAAEALRVLNAYQHGPRRARIVLTCRTRHYDSLTEAGAFARDATRITLRPLNAAQAEDFLDDIVVGTDRPRWQPVLEALAQDGHPLAQALSTPWRLTLATTVYTEPDPDPDTGDPLRDPRDLLALADANQVRDHLLARYIPAACTTTPGRHDPDQVHRYLAYLARYLNDNTTRPPVYGRALSATDLVLHQLWPLAGGLPNRLTSALTFLLFTPFVFVMRVAGAPWGAVIPLLMGMVFAVLTRKRPWTEPARLDWAQLKTRHGLYKVAAGLAIGLAIGFTGGLAIGLAAGLAIGLTIGLASGLALGLSGKAVKSGTDPREPIRNDLLGWLAFGLAAGLAIGLVFGLLRSLADGIVFGLAGGFAGGLAIGLADGFTGGPAAVRYWFLLVCTRGRLPWFLGRFLDWCYSANLIRVSGIAYQFRHRELQEYLATRPHPLPAAT